MNHRARLKAESAQLFARTSVSVAVALALYGAPHAALAEQPAEPAAGEITEIVVTATRREQSLESVPYSLTVVSADELLRTGVTDIVSLTAQVPGLSQFDYGARTNASTTPIIRGLSASGGQPNTRAFRNLEQSPVGAYMGNSPVEGYFQLDDIARIEVLRGPQGTLYGAGALGGALRIIPNDPQLGVTSGSVDASGDTVAHSSGVGYTTSAMLNLPIGDTLALRVAGKYASEPGFIDAFGILQRSGPILTGAPALANPSDPVNSPGIFTTQDDWNRQDTLTGRASLLWQPGENFRANLALLYANLNGAGGPVANTAYIGGADPVDPRVTLPAGGDYRLYSAIEQPYWRRTSLTSLDLSYDAGFATLSSTSSYAKEDGSTTMDSTYLGGLKFFAGYYAGNPVNPRYIAPQEYDDSGHTFTQELRLVSNAGEGRALDYVVGVFYEKQESTGTWNIASPGTYARAVSQGCTAPYFLGAPFPACLPPAGPNGINWSQLDQQNFEDKSVFGELSWHFSSRGQITFGGRHFKQSFDDLSSIENPTFATYVAPVLHSAPASKNTWKVNPSYEYATGHFAYATWSQGFRRGGANPLPAAGIYKENPLLDQYVPDSVDNYEAGIKGYFANGQRYTLAVFDMEWKDPQISTTLPAGTVAVINGKKAKSRGVEFDASGPLLVDGLSYTTGAAYADATLTQAFSYAANNGGGTITPDLVKGVAGQQLPGSPKVSAAATLTYSRDVAAGYGLSVSLNGTYRSRVVQDLRTLTPPVSPGFGLVNLSTMLIHGAWHGGVYATNLMDRRVILQPAVPSTLLPPVGSTPYLSDTINRPREIGLRLGYSFGGGSGSGSGKK